MSALDEMLNSAALTSDWKGIPQFTAVEVGQASAELTHLRACESWILEHAQHGANCMAGADRKYPCTCGLAKIMEEMP